VRPKLRPKFPSHYVDECHVLGVTKSRALTERCSGRVIPQSILGCHTGATQMQQRPDRAHHAVNDKFIFLTNCHSIVVHLRVVLALLGRDATSIPLLFALPFPSPPLPSPRLSLGRDTLSTSLRASFWETGTRHDVAVPLPLPLSWSCCVPSRIVLGRDVMLCPFTHRSGTRPDVAVPPHLILGDCDPTQLR
jgi:hypothetical protein